MRMKSGERGGGRTAVRNCDSGGGSTVVMSGADGGAIKLLRGRGRKRNVKREVGVRLVCLRERTWLTGVNI